MWDHHLSAARSLPKPDPVSLSLSLQAPAEPATDGNTAPGDETGNAIHLERRAISLQTC